uniref:Transmembrane 9 superfamily member n=1 Tax=Ananas comosus var. bracteatus TaxID=296719 RepID=A0A6V7P4H5_ANACO|nr:unnamed protein product [Ananas comosus var. bracteatus]
MLTLCSRVSLSPVCVYFALTGLGLIPTLSRAVDKPQILNSRTAFPRRIKDEVSLPAGRGLHLLLHLRPPARRRLLPPRQLPAPLRRRRRPLREGELPDLRRHRDALRLLLSALLLPPPDGIKDSAENLGEILLGDRIENSPYRFNMHVNDSAVMLCRSDPLAPDALALLKERIDELYQVNLILDNLPAIRYTRNNDGYSLRWTGYPVGIRVRDGGAYYVFNHLKFTVLVHRYEEKTQNEAPGWMVVGFEVVPCSVAHDSESVKSLRMYDKYPGRIECDPSVVAMAVGENQPIVFTYEVAFVESDVKWPSRWDAYLKMEGAKVHWFSILNSLMVIAFLAGIVLVILLRTVRRDLARYEELDKEAQEQMNEELSGWKLVVGDVFRAPSHPLLLCAMVGDGVQILGMAVVTILFAALGFMSPASRELSSPGCSSSTWFSESRLVLTYMHLCVEDWKWWWKSFFASGSVAIYIFLYSVNYLVFDLKSLSGPISATLYLGYSLFMVIAVMLATGTVGFLSSFWFVHYLFSSVKLD